MDAQRIILFIDDKNIYHGARRAFFSSTDPHPQGQVNPVLVGQLICNRPPPGFSYSLSQVRVYTGRPDVSKQPKTYAAHLRQCDVWEKSGAMVITRSLRYPYNWPETREEQKGVDVMLAIDFISLALDGAYDVGVIASTDTDLKPALEFVLRRLRGRCGVEVVSWKNPSPGGSRLSIPGANIWCHWLDRPDYNSVADLTDYNI